MDQMEQVMSYTILDLGSAPSDRPERWGDDRRVRRVIRVLDVAPSGRRYGSRILGLGWDALRAASTARFGSARGPFVAMNPWTAVAARLLGMRDVCVVGLYATEGTLSWRVLRLVLRSSPIATLSKHEADRWSSHGGVAAPVRYGAEFPPVARTEGEKRSARYEIFVGGSSDRDARAIDALVAAVRTRQHGDIRLTLAVGGPAPHSDGVVDRYGSISSQQFSTLLDRADVVFLPLTDNGRAAGHMVLTEALQRGKPVVATWVAGMAEYFDGVHVDRAGDDLLPQLLDTADRWRARGQELGDYWARNHSASAFGRNLLDTFDELRDEVRR